MNKVCQTCGSEKLTLVSGKCSDLFWYRNEWSGYEHDGYVVLKEINDGLDYVSFTFCRDCGQIQGDWPNPPKKFVPPCSC